MEFSTTDWHRFSRRLHNDLPVAANTRGTLNEDTSITGKLPAATDADGDKVSYALATPAANGKATVNADGSYSYVPNANFHGKDTFKYSVTDGKGGSNTYTVDLTVNPVNDAPVAANASHNLNEDTRLTGKLPAATDVDGDQVSYTLTTQATNGKATVNADGSYSYVPNANFHGKDAFTYSINDGKGGTNTYTVSLTINAAPVAANANGTLDEDTRFTDKLPAATDADGDKVSYALATQAANGKATVNADGSYSYVPNANFHGTDSFTYSVNDDKGGINTYTVSLTINSIEDLPVAANASQILDEDTRFTGNLPTATDGDGDQISYSLETQATNGKATVNADGSYSYVPNANFHGTDAFTYSVSDDKGGSNTYTVSLTVNSVNDLPVAANTSATLDEDTRYSGKLPTATDADGDKVTYALVTQPVNGEATINADGSYSYTPYGDFHGKDSFIYSVNDGKGGSNNYSVNLTINSVNDAPVSFGLIKQSESKSIINGYFSASTSGYISAFDADGDQITFTLLTQPDRGYLNLKNNGSYTYNASGYSSTVSFQYAISDGIDSNQYTGTIYL